MSLKQYENVFARKTLTKYFSLRKTELKTDVIKSQPSKRQYISY
jgi:hypothetical protein